MLILAFEANSAAASLNCTFLKIFSLLCKSNRSPIDLSRCLQLKFTSKTIIGSHRPPADHPCMPHKKGCKCHATLWFLEEDLCLKNRGSMFFSFENMTWIWMGSSVCLLPNLIANDIQWAKIWKRIYTNFEIFLNSLD